VKFSVSVFGAVIAIACALWIVVEGTAHIAEPEAPYLAEKNLLMATLSEVQLRNSELFVEVGKLRVEAASAASGLEVLKHDNKLLRDEVIRMTDDRFRREDFENAMEAASQLNKGWTPPRLAPKESHDGR